MWAEAVVAKAGHVGKVMTARADVGEGTATNRASRSLRHKNSMRFVLLVDALRILHSLVEESVVARLGASFHTQGE